MIIDQEAFQVVGYCNFVILLVCSGAHFEREISMLSTKILEPSLNLFCIVRWKKTSSSIFSVEFNTGNPEAGNLRGGDGGREVGVLTDTLGKGKRNRWEKREAGVREFGGLFSVNLNAHFPVIMMMER